MFNGFETELETKAIFNRIKVNGRTYGNKVENDRKFHENHFTKSEAVKMFYQLKDSKLDSHRLYGRARSLIPFDFISFHFVLFNTLSVSHTLWMMNAENSENYP